jgi:hypothetical protein
MSYKILTSLAMLFLNVTLFNVDVLFCAVKPPPHYIEGTDQMKIVVACNHNGIENKNLLSAAIFDPKLGGKHTYLFCSIVTKNNIT